MNLMPAFKLSVDENQIALLHLDLEGEKVNKLTAAVVQEAEEIFDDLRHRSDLRAIVLISDKENTFIAGADIQEFLKFESASQAAEASRSGQRLLQKIADMKIPVVAAIQGACLGGGMEVALACHYRICADDRKTQLGQPEVKLGLLPGAGGTQRLPPLVGLQNAIEIATSGRNYRPQQALRTGIVDEVVPRPLLLHVALTRAGELGEGKIRPRRHRPQGLLAWALECNPVGRWLLFRQAEKMIREKTHGHYPAPLRALGAIRAGVSQGPVKGYMEESKAFGDLAMTSTCRQLIHLFFATTDLKKDPGMDGPSIRPQAVAPVGILGAGFMGAGIAAVCSSAGVNARLRDVSEEACLKGLTACYRVFDDRFRRKSISRLELQQLKDRVSATTELNSFSTCGLIIEAVIEDVDLKHQVVREVEPHLRDDCVWGSNTSSISIAKLAEASRRPEQFIGLHFFSPVHKMPLLEIIVTRQTSKQTIATSVEYGKLIGKFPIVVNDGVGFYTSRILSPYMNEASFILEEGAPVEALDQAMIDFGFPVGPMTLLDEVGIDVAAKVGKIMLEAFGERLKPPSSMEQLIQNGRLGRKLRKGFYQYVLNRKEEVRKVGVDPTIYDLLPGGRNRKPVVAGDIQSRLSMAMLNECARCLEEGILRSPRDGDIGAVMGLGFPPFQGGPFRYMDAMGLENVLRNLESLQKKWGDRFKPSEMIVRMAESKESFYS
ncbi:MAG: fatty acid oxidation complex subunit alpha FadJ [Acidobacteriia bacterium]|nr:fatty acid oxidation complex subunit alpha FadJ [Terriglobia bacterium]